MQEAEKGVTHILSADKVLNETQAQARCSQWLPMGFPCTAVGVLQLLMVAHDNSWLMVLVMLMACERWGPCLFLFVSSLLMLDHG